MNRRDSLKHMKRMENALNFMIDHIREKLTLEEVAAAKDVKFNPAYFGDVFYEYYEMPWRVYYLKLKMRAAARHIKKERTNRNAAQIFGYLDAKNFAQIFKKEIGVTPARFLESGCDIPDMPERSQLCGVPIRMEYTKKDEISISGIPLYKPSTEGPIDRMEDAAYALTRTSEWQDKLGGKPYVGIWSYDEHGREHYLIGDKSHGSPVKNALHQNIGGGQYAVFSAERSENDEENVVISRMLARYAMFEWREVNKKDTNALGYTYEVFDEDRLYLYVPLLGDYGNNENWHTSMQASLFREYIDSHITEPVSSGEFARESYFTERWVRDSFKGLYGISPQKYIETKRLRLAAREILENVEDKSEILLKYHFSSMALFSRKFIQHFRVHYKDYEETPLPLPESIEVCWGQPRKVKVREVSLPTLKTALHPVTLYPEYTKAVDYPGLVTYWFTHDWNYKHTGYDKISSGNVDKVFIYDSHLYDREGPAVIGYTLGPILEENGRKISHVKLQEGYQERIIPGGRYILFEIEEEYKLADLLEIYQQMESTVFLKWYHDNQLMVNTTKEKLVRYINGKLYFYVPMEI